MNHRERKEHKEAGEILGAKNGARVICGDCLEVLAGMDSGSVDAFVTDPPYFVGAVSVGNSSAKTGSWADLTNGAFWFSAWIREAWRVLRDDGYLCIFTNWRSQPMLMKACADAGVGIASCAVWNKEWIGPAGPSQLRPTYELILFCAKPGARISDRGRSDVFVAKWMAGHCKTTEHPAEKPVALIREILRTVQQREEIVVCDPFAGSGTTGVAALELGCSFVGIELDEKWHAVATKRLAQGELVL